MVVMGALLVIPGGYASALLFGAYHGWDGWHYEAVPSYDD